MAPEGGLDAAVEVVVDSLLRGGPGALAAAKRLAAEVAELGYENCAEHCAGSIAAARATPEAQAALAAFLARTPAPWTPAGGWALPPCDGEVRS